MIQAELEPANGEATSQVDLNRKSLVFTIPTLNPPVFRVAQRGKGQKPLHIMRRTVFKYLCPYGDGIPVRGRTPVLIVSSR